MMKKYNRPNMEIVEFDIEEIITDSVKDGVIDDADSSIWGKIDSETYNVDMTDSYKM